MRFSAETKKTFVPKFHGNMDLDESEQVVVEYDVISSLSLKTIKPKRDVEYTYDQGGSYTGMKMKLIQDEFALITGFAPKIKNFTYPDRDGGKDKKITNAQTLFEAPSSIGGPLIKELAEKLREESREIDATEEDEKKSE